MSKRIFFAVLILLIVFSSFSMASANDINITDTLQQSHVDDNVVSAVDVEEVQGYSNNLSTNNLNSFDDYTVSSGNVSVNINVPDIELYYKNGTRLFANLSDVDGNALANQSLIFEINHQEYIRNTTDLGQASIPINLNPGNYSVKVYYLGDGTYLNNSAEASVSVLPTVFGDDVVKYFKNDTQYYALFLDAYGNPLVNATASVNINGVFYNRTTDDKGIAKLNINLPEGVYILTAYHPYTNGAISNTVTVLPTIHANNVTKYYKNGTQYYATFLDGMGNALSNTKVAFNINGVFYNRTTNGEGIAKMDINLGEGVYTLTAYHPNDDKASSIIEVLPVIYAENITKIYRDDMKFNALFVDGVGDPIVGASVLFNINGKFYNRTTDSYGIAGLGINLLQGDYIITAYHPNGYARANMVTVLSSSTTTIATNDYEFNLGDNKTIDFVLYNQLGYGISNQTVHVTAGDKVYDVTTDSEGVGRVTLDLDYGTYNVKYEFNGEDRYSSSNNVSLVEVYEGFDSQLIAEDTILYANNSETFNITLLDADDNPIVGKTVYIGAEGSKMYSRTTDSNGAARLTINWGSGNYDMVSIFNETGYKPVYVFSSLTVIKDNVSSFTTENITVGYGFSKKLTAYLKVGDVPLINRKVTLNINGREYTRTTNEDGMISIAINLPVGSYVIDYNYAGEQRIAPSTGQSLVTVKERAPTSVSWVSSTSFVEGSTSTLQVKLADANSNPLSGEDITFIISSREYNATTNAEGIASLPRTFSSGTYSVSYKFEGNNDYAPSEGITQITVASVNKNTYGYWAFGRDMYSINLPALSSLGTGNIFLNFAAFGLYGENEVISWIKTANTYGINVHIWMQAFYESGSWVNPVSGGSPNQAYFNQKIDEAKHYASLEGVAGIHLDYLRYPGTAYKTSGSAQAINEFARQLTTAVKEINSNIIVSAAVMPETSGNIYYYGQDIPTLSKYLDVIVPMQYKGNYNSGASWLTSTTKWFVSNSQGAQIWSGLQGYVSDENVAKLTVSELTADAQTVLSAGAAGVVIFRWGITSYIDFNSLDNPSYGGYVSTEDIVSTASDLKEYIENNGILPATIAVGDEYYTISQVLGMMAGAVMKLNGQLESDIVAQIVAIPDNSQGDDIYASLSEEDYLKVASDVYSYCLNQKQAPNSINSTSGLIKYETLVYMFSKVLAFYDSYDDFPLTVTINNLLDHYNLTVSMYPSASNTGYAYMNYTTTWLNYCPNCGLYGTLLINPKHTKEGELTCSHCDCDYCGVSGHEKVQDSDNVLTRLSESVPVSEGDVGVDVSIDSILEGAVYLKEYIKENGALPDYVVLSVGKYTMPQFLYLMGRAISNINSGVLTPVAIVDSNSPSSPGGDYINGSLPKDDYVDVAKRVADFIVANSQAPNYASSTLGKIAYAELLDSFSRVLNYYASYSTLPSSVIIDYVAPSTQSILDLAKSLTNGLTSDRDKAVALFNYVRDNIAYSFYYNTQKGAEGTLIAGSGNCCDQSQLLVAMARAVGLTVRFATGYCTFSSGSYGHVWVQFNIDGSWINADPVSNRNSFGVINNWNTNTYTSSGVYDILPY